MRLRLPYIHTVVGIPVGHRKPSSRRYGGYKDVDITEVSGREAPIAMSWLNHDGDTKYHTRWFDENHWCPILSAKNDSAEVTAVEQLARHPSAVLRDVSEQPGCGSELDNIVANGGPYFSRAEFREGEIHDDGIEAALRQAHKLAGDVLVVDGEVYSRTPEPRYTISSRDFLRGGEQKLSVYIDIERTFSRAVNPHNGPQFRADRYDDARDYIRHRFPDRRLRKHQMIDVHIAHSVCFDDDRHAIVETAKAIIDPEHFAVVREDCYQLLRHATAADSAAWFGLRDAIAAADPDVNAIAEFCEKIGTALPDDSKLKPHISDAVQRWSLRPLDLQSIRP